MGPPEIRWLRRLFAYFHMRNGERPINLVGSESDLVALLDLVEHRRLLYPKHHSHRWHVKVLQLTMLYRDFARTFVDLADLAFAHGCGSGGCLRIMMRGMVSAGLGRERPSEQGPGHGD